MVHNVGYLIVAAFDAAMAVMFVLVAPRAKPGLLHRWRRVALTLLGAGSACHAINLWELAFSGPSAPDAHAAFWVGTGFVVAGFVCAMVALVPRRSGGR